MRSIWARRSGSGRRCAAEGRADLVEEHHGKHKVVQDIRVKGKLETSLEVPCARCLDPVVHQVERSFDLLYRPLGTDAGHEELSVTDAEAEIGYYEGEGLLLEDTLREQVLLALPLKTICREDCKGLCPHCGKNLNEIQCSCVDAGRGPALVGAERDTYEAESVKESSQFPVLSSQASGLTESWELRAEN